MRSWHERHTVEQLQSVVASAVERGLLADERSCLFHDLSLLRRRLADLADAFPSNALHAVAIKANPLVEVLKVAVEAGAGLEAASWEEVTVALAAGCPPEKIVFDSPAKTNDEIRRSLALGLLLNANSLDELARIDELHDGTSTSRIGLRVNPMVGSGSIAITSVAGERSKFGVPLDQARGEIVDTFGRYEWLRGLHVHVGSQGCTPELLTAAGVRIAGLVDEIRAIHAERVSFVDIGGGLPARYESDAPSFDVLDYAGMLRNAAPTLFSPDIELVTEFGRALQAGCGFALSRVEYLEPRDDQQMAIIHLGADMFMRPVYHPDEWPHEYLALDASGGAKRGDARASTVAGPLCFAGDVLARGVPLPPLEPGDHVVIRDTGAYTLSMWSRHCSRGMPLVLGFDGDPIEFRVLRRSESADDVARFWSADPTH